MSQPTAVVAALTATGLSVARSLHGAGWRVLGADADRSRPGVHSRVVQMNTALAGLPLGLQLADSVAHLQANGPVVVLPAADDAVQWCIAHRDTLTRRARLSTGLTAERAGVLLDKSAFGAACQRLGIDVPATMQPRDMAEVRAFAREFGLPCIVKPRAGHVWRQRLRGQKLLVPANERELEAALALVGDPTEVVLQELVPGPESQLVVGAVWAADDGGVRHVLTARKIRQFPRNFGSGSMVRTESLPEVREASARIVEQLDYRGLCGTEFKIDPRTGRLRLIEINPRPTLWYDLCRAAGCDLIRAHGEELAGLPGPRVQPQRDGVVWRYLVRDAIALVQAGPWALARSLWQDRRLDADAVLAWNDPGAALASVAHAAVQAVTHLKR